MCVPVAAVAVAGLVASVAAAGASAYGQYQQTQAANNAAAYNAQVATYQEQQATALGKVQAEQNNIQVAQLQGRQKAEYAAAGVDPNSGSPLTVQSQTAGYGALDSLAIKQNAASQAWGYSNEANLDSLKYVNAYGTAGTSLLNSTSNIGQSALRSYQTGAYQGI